jgi:hypothetical protein
LQRLDSDHELDAISSLLRLARVSRLHSGFHPQGYWSLVASPRRS